MFGYLHFAGGVKYTDEYESLSRLSGPATKNHWHLCWIQANFTYKYIEKLKETKFHIYLNTLII